jgi:Ca2+-transporting ATPase
LPQLGFLSNRWLLGAIAVSAMLQLAAIALPFFQQLFRIETSGFSWEWMMIVVLACAPVSVVEIAKLLRARRASTTRAAVAGGGGLSGGSAQ